MEVLDERKAQGVSDGTGKEASLLEEAAAKYERGKKNLETLSIDMV